MLKKLKLIRVSLPIIFIVLMLVAFGCVMIYSASMFSADYHFGNSMFFAYKQLIGAVLGLFSMMFFCFFDYHKLKKFRWIILAVTIVLLILVFIPGIGVESYGAKRWINVLGFSIQPSEIAKFALVLFLSSYLSDHHDKIKKFKPCCQPLQLPAYFACW